MLSIIFIYIENLFKYTNFTFAIMRGGAGVKERRKKIG